MVRHFINLFLWLLPPSRMFSVRRFFLRVAGVDVGNGASVCGRGWIYGRGRLHIGQDTWISPGVTMHTHVDAPIVIGANCDIATGVEFVPGSHEIGGARRRAGAGIAGPISVGDGCWIGAGVYILGGTSIGAGSVVAAGAVVVRDVPPNVLVAGVPAIVKKQLA
jgi:maltose O-acetyltransferase